MVDFFRSAVNFQMQQRKAEVLRQWVGYFITYRGWRLIGSPSCNQCIGQIRSSLGGLAHKTITVDFVSLQTSKMLNMAGEGMDQVDSKSAFMELQGQGMGPMGHHAPYPRSYPGQHPSNMDSVYSSSHMGQPPRAPLGYPFPMSTMSPHGTYQPTGHHPFNMSPYQTAPTPPTPRDGDYSREYSTISDKNIKAEVSNPQLKWLRVHCHH